MGAVFAILGAYYNWSPYITGYKYNEVLGKIQFWSFFIGVNILFFPMHFLGLAGMPRRIPDYPDAYIGWNYIASYGSLITLFSFILFFFILFYQLNNKLSPNNPYRAYFNNVYDIRDKNNSIEYVLTYPPRYHTYNQLPIL